MDVKVAYLNPKTDEEVHLEQPKGFKKISNGNTLVCRFKTSIYELKQAALISAAFNFSKSAWFWEK